MANKKMKTYLKLLMVVGLIAVVGGGSGTFASFSAETTNKENTFKTGTLLLSDSVKSGTACFSNEAASNKEESNCSAVIKAEEMKPGEGKSNYLTIKNVGTLASSDLKLWGSTCAEKEDTKAFEKGAAKNEITPGKVCEELKISIEQDEEAGAKATKCLVGKAVGVGNEACKEEEGVTLKSWLESNSSGEKAFTFSGDSLEPAAQRFYTVYLYLPKAAGNEYQGRIAEFGLTWHIDQ
ncbi:MAG: SipW-dependent-type signal peptide-containing protein [Solirubrobacteraceae bacterium]